LLRAVDRKRESAIMKEHEREPKRRFSDVKRIAQAILAKWNAGFDEFLRTWETEMAPPQSMERPEFEPSVTAELTPPHRRKSLALTELRVRARLR
jgi:hypothetical protein